MATFLSPIENPSSPMLKLVYAMYRAPASLAR